MRAPGRRRRSLRRPRRDHRQRRPDGRRRVPTASGCPPSDRVVCPVPAFAKGANATENSLIGSGRSLGVENNYGYQDPFGPTQVRSHGPGSRGWTSTSTSTTSGWCQKPPREPPCGYQSSPRQPRLDRALGASASGAKQSRHRRRDASQARPLPDKGSRARGQLRSSGAAPGAPDRRDRRVARLSENPRTTGSHRIANLADASERRLRAAERSARVI